MLYRFIFSIFLLLLTGVSSAEYEGKKRLKTSINYNGSATVTIEIDLEDKFNYVNHANAAGEVEKLEVTSGSFEILGAGMHRLRFIKELPSRRGETIPLAIWVQDVYIPFPQPTVAEELAKQYMPISIFHTNENYFPQSLDDILSYNRSGNDSIKVYDPTLLTNPKLNMGQDLKTYLEYNGHSSSAFDFGTIESTCALNDDALCDLNIKPLFLRFSTGNVNDATVYWDASEEAGSLYIAYYFFYAFDPKKSEYGSPGSGAHAFDRESITIRFTQEDGEYTPRSVTYAGHLATQRLNLMKCNDHSTCDSFSETELLGWEGGKTSIPWDYILKAGKHPVLYKAHGAHAVYPTYGHYEVLTAGLDLLDEPAGSLENSKLLLPGKYSLRKLDYASLKYLAFSGYWVDVRLIEGAKFPPFEGRAPHSNWVSQTNYIFFECLIDTDPSDNCIEVKKHFSHVKGLNNFRPVTVEVKDSLTEEVIPHAEVKIISEDGFSSSAVDSATTLSDGMHTFFFEPVLGVTYKISSFKDGYSETDCEVTMIDTTALIPNNKESYVCYLTEETALTGTIQGSVKDVLLDTPIIGSEVKIFQSGVLKDTIATDGSGNYGAELPVGEYSLTISAEGYITEENIIVTVTEDERTTVTALRQVPTEYSGDGTVSGIISDAISGNSLSSVNLQFRMGVNVTDGTVINSTITTSFGAYEIVLSAGNYTIEASKEGYTTGYFNVVSIGTQVKDGQNSSISPIISEEEIRIVLSWGASPSDLDSHLWTPNIEGSAYHVYFSSQGSSSSAPYAQLDTDDTSSYGPETITLTSRFPGTYNYSVYNYSGSPDIKSSSAKVEVYSSAGLVRTYNIPLAGDGRFWNVFSINGADGEITSIDEISSSAPTVASRGTSYYKTTGKSGVK